MTPKDTAEKQRTLLRLGEIDADGTADELATEIEAPASERRRRTWTEEFSASGEKGN